MVEVYRKASLLLLSARYDEDPNITPQRNVHIDCPRPRWVVILCILCGLGHIIPDSAHHTNHENDNSHDTYDTEDQLVPRQAVYPLETSTWNAKTKT